MNTLKLNFTAYTLITAFMMTVFMTSCEQGEVIPDVQNTASIETGKFTKELTVVSENQSEFKLKVSSDDNVLLSLIDAQLFNIEPIFEAPEIEQISVDNNSELMTDIPYQVPKNLLIIDVEQQQVEGSVGYRIAFNHNETINSRYDRVSIYARSNSHKKIYTRNTDNTSIKMKYYDDDVYAGYRSLCSGPCPQLTYIFSRSDNGVGCEFEYWSYASPNVTRYFFN